MPSIKGGRYLTVEDYRRLIGYTSPQPIYRAIRDGRLVGAVRVGHIWIIPSDAVIINRQIKTGNYVGIRARNREAKKNY